MKWTQDLRGTGVGKWVPLIFSQMSSRSRVIWKPFLLVLSPSSHFNLSVQPHTSSSHPPLPREAGVQWPRSVHARPSWHASSSPLCSPSTQISTGLETNIHVFYIIHGSSPGCRIKRRSITQHAHNEDGKCPVQECRKEKNRLLSK